MSRNVEVILMFWKAACGLNFLQDKFDENIYVVYQFLFHICLQINLQ